MNSPVVKQDFSGKIVLNQGLIELNPPVSGAAHSALFWGHCRSLSSAIQSGTEFLKQSQQSCLKAATDLERFLSTAKGVVTEDAESIRVIANLFRDFGEQSEKAAYDPLLQALPVPFRLIEPADEVIAKTAEEVKNKFLINMRFFALHFAKLENAAEQLEILITKILAKPKSELDDITEAALNRLEKHTVFFQESCQGAVNEHDLTRHGLNPFQMTSMLRGYAAEILSKEVFQEFTRGLPIKYFGGALNRVIGNRICDPALKAEVIGSALFTEENLPHDPLMQSYYRLGLLDYFQNLNGRFIAKYLSSEITDAQREKLVSDFTIQKDIHCITLFLPLVKPLASKGDKKQTEDLTMHIVETLAVNGHFEEMNEQYAAGKNYISEKGNLELLDRVFKGVSLIPPEHRKRPLVAFQHLLVKSSSIVDAPLAKHYVARVKELQSKS